MKILILILGIVIGVTAGKYIDYKKTEKYYDAAIERSRQETERMKEFTKTIGIKTENVKIIQNRKK